MFLDFLLPKATRELMKLNKLHEELNTLMFYRDERIEQIEAEIDKLTSIPEKTSLVKFFISLYKKNVLNRKK